MKSIAAMLKSKRQETGYSVAFVVKELEKYEISIATKTLYGYENDVSVPDAYVLLALCDIYGIDNLMTELGYRTKRNPDFADTIRNINQSDKQIINKFLMLSDRGKYKIEGKIDDYLEEEGKSEFAATLTPEQTEIKKKVESYALELALAEKGVTATASQIISEETKEKIVGEW